MTQMIRLALIGASILAIASPAIARTAAKGDRMTCYQAASGQWLCNSPVSLYERPSPVRAPRETIYDSNPNAGYDYPAPLAVGGDVL